MTTQRYNYSYFTAANENGDGQFCEIGNNTARSGTSACLVTPPLSSAFSVPAPSKFTTDRSAYLVDGLLHLHQAQVGQGGLDEVHDGLQTVVLQDQGLVTPQKTQSHLDRT